MQQVLDRRLVHLQRVHEVLRVPSYPQLVALPELALARLQVAWRVAHIGKLNLSCTQLRGWLVLAKLRRQQSKKPLPEMQHEDYRMLEQHGYQQPQRRLLMACGSMERSPASRFMSVVLPAPLGPTMATREPMSTPMFRSCHATAARFDQSEPL